MPCIEDRAVLGQVMAYERCRQLSSQTVRRTAAESSHEEPVHGQPRDAECRAARQAMGERIHRRAALHDAHQEARYQAVARSAAVHDTSW